jgi:type III secretory pathway component EscS
MSKIKYIYSDKTLWLFVLIINPRILNGTYVGAIITK